MIYDYQDMATKVYLAQTVREWCSDPQNVSLLEKNNTLKDITGIAIDGADTDYHVYTVLFLIGVGLFRYFHQRIDNTVRFSVAVDPGWQIPGWMQNPQLLSRVGQHVGDIMESERLFKGEPVVALEASLDVIKDRARRFSEPQEPTLDVENERRKIKRLRLEQQQKKIWER